MGCNTSKDAALSVGGENAEANEDKVETKGEQESSKPESAKTVTLTSNGFVLPKVEEKSEIKEINQDDLTNDPELAEAAVKIQAVFRGHKTRKTMKQPAKHEDTSPSTQALEEEFSPDDKGSAKNSLLTSNCKSFFGLECLGNLGTPRFPNIASSTKTMTLPVYELCHAATKIQAQFRGHMSRKNMDKPDEPEPSANTKHEEEEELDIDLADPDLHKAAVKIQASFRGHMVRKDNENAPTDTK